jgi:hypothetical protein
MPYVDCTYILGLSAWLGGHYTNYVHSLLFIRIFNVDSWSIEFNELI